MDEEVARCAVPFLTVWWLFYFYHTFRWSEYGNNDSDNNDQNDDNTGCRGDGEDWDENWYMGLTQCFRANVAYTLYGVKTGQTVSGKGACSKAHYINSFFTNGGIESFGDAVGVDYEDSGASTECSSDQVDDEEGDNNNNNNQGGDDDNHNYLIYTNYVSYGTACSRNGEFIQAQFQGAYCDGNHFLANNGEFEDLNSALDELGCLQVYGGEAEETDDNNNNEDADSIATSLLSYSASCSHTEYPDRCPDPYGVKRKRDNRLSSYSKAQFRAVPLVMPILSSLLFAGAALFFYFTHQFSEKTKKNVLADPMDGVRGTPVLLTRISESFARTVTGLSTRTMSIKEKLVEYAEAEDDDEEDGDYQSPTEPTITETRADGAAPKADEDPNAAVADAMLAEKGVTPLPKAGEKKKKKYKRPRLAKISKFFFGRRKKKSQAQI
jgi:hypothetical protein